ncbi:hypothetical protein B7P43_G07139 [Cryptotermes secundus]|uniref:Uncharacterized protein n=1 Tax=Cryptotermes secundus TaxID=105785 RepID=A0A2J7Q2B2_9NEOP|nr:hypothetical protein B7P43_G07139 [Cryptotermes secundus]
MNAWGSGQNEFRGTLQAAGTSATVAPQHYITLLVNGSYAHPVTLQRVQPTYVPFVQDSRNQAYYARTDVPISYPQHMVREPGANYTTQHGQYYPESTTAAIYRNMVRDLMQETTADQSLPKDNSAYLIQQGVRQDTAHESIGAQSVNLQAKKGDAVNVKNILPRNTNADPSSLYGDGHRESSKTTITSPITVLWLMQNYEGAEEFSETRAIRNFANGLKPGPTGTMTHCPEEISESVNCECFGADFTALYLINLLDGAELAVLRNSSKIDRMLDDLNPVDFRSIRSYKNRHHRQAALKALDKHQINLKLVWNGHVTLMELAKHNRVQLIWVPGHEGIAGNEIADRLAKIGAQHPFTGPEPACGISIGVATKAIRDWTNMNHKKCWRSLTGLRQAKGLIGGPSTERAKELLKLNRNQLRWVVELLTGYCHFKGHLFKLGLSDSPTCERCQEENETATHILYECEALAYLRLCHLGQYFMEPSDYFDVPTYRIQRFE